MSLGGKVTFSHIKNVFINALFKKNKPPPLGRWNIHKDNKLKLVVNYSNEDHCGTCAQYVQIKKQEINKKKLDDKQEKIYKDEYTWLSSNTQD